MADWFVLVLRPALREPRLAVPSKERAKELIILALDSGRDLDDSAAAPGFRNHIVNLYLHHASDIHDGADLGEEKRQPHMKSNLEDILLQYGLHRPDVRLSHPSRNSI